MTAFVRSTSTVIQCKVVLLDNTEFVTAFEKKSIRGEDLLDRVCARVQVPPICKKYFGLRYADREDGGLNWLDSDKEIQASRKTKELQYQFAVKVFPQEPRKLDKFVQRQVVLQLKELVTQGKLCLPVDKHAILDGLYAQAMLGNFNPKKHTPGYLDDLLGLFYTPPNGLNVDGPVGLTSGVNYEVMVRDLHKSHKGASEEDAINEYLNQSRALPYYGEFVHRGAAGSDGNEVIIGVSNRGIRVSELDEFNQPGNQLHLFHWRDILSIFCDKTKFFIISSSFRAADSETNENTCTFSFCFSHGHFGHKTAKRLFTDAENHQGIILEEDPEREAKRSTSVQLKRKARQDSGKFLGMPTQAFVFRRGSNRF